MEENDLGNKGLYKSQVDMNINIIIFFLQSFGLPAYPPSSRPKFLEPATHKVRCTWVFTGNGALEARPGSLKLFW